MGETTHSRRTCESCGSPFESNRRKRGTCVRCRLFANAAAGDTGCIVWTASTNKDGYGKLNVDGTTRAAHRLSYELMVGLIPNGFVLDHLCHTRDTACSGGSNCLHRRCINPLHLEPVTERTNILRGRCQAAANAAKTHCPRGHEYSEANTRIDKNGKRHCRACRAYHELQARNGLSGKRATA